MWRVQSAAEDVELSRHFEDRGVDLLHAELNRKAEESGLLLTWPSDYTEEVAR